MKSLPIASFALVLALSGCSSSPSIEEQRKLVEYDNCIEHEIAKANQMTSFSGTLNKPLLSGLPETIQVGNNFTKFKDYSDLLDECRQYRP